MDWTVHLVKYTGADDNRRPRRGQAPFTVPAIRERPRPVRGVFCEQRRWEDVR